MIYLTDKGKAFVIATILAWLFFIGVGNGAWVMYGKLTGWELVWQKSYP